MILGVISAVLVVGLLGFCAVIAVGVSRETMKKEN